MIKSKEDLRIYLTEDEKALFFGQMHLVSLS